MSVSSELNGENLPALRSSVRVGPTMLQVMHKQNLLLEQSNKQSKMTFDLLSLMLAQLKSQSATSTTAGSSLKRSRTENEADGDQADNDEAHSEKKQAVSSPFSPTWSLVVPLMTLNRDRDLEAERNKYFMARA